MNKKVKSVEDLAKEAIICGSDGVLRVKNSGLKMPAWAKALLYTGLCLLLLSCFFVPCVLGIQSMHTPLPTGKALRHSPITPYAYILQVAAPATLFSSNLSPYGPGFEQELLQDFCDRHGFRLEFISAASREEAFDLLRQGKANLVAGFGGEVPQPLEGEVVDGPAYAQFKPIMVYEAAGADPVERPFSVAADLTPQASGGNSSGFLLDPAAYALWVPLNNGVRTGRLSGQQAAYRWFWSRSDKVLDVELERFWSDPATSADLKEMTERYYGFFPKKPQPEDLKALSAVIEDNLLHYNKALLKASEQSGLDPLLIAAVIFQESRFDPAATSSTGVRGIMQLTQSTANMLKVNRMDPEDCIIGGARYLRILWDELEGLELETWDRWCLALAAFNQGPGNLKKVLRHVDKNTVPTWAALKGLYPKVARQGLGDASFRGREAVDFVENVRYYYYVLSGLAGLARAERQDLTALLTLVPAS